MAAAVLSLASVANIWLIYRIALRMGMRTHAALAAACLMASATSMVYYARLSVVFLITMAVLCMFVGPERLHAANT